MRTNCLKRCMYWGVCIVCIILCYLSAHSSQQQRTRYFFIFSCGAPIYEVPTGTYSGEQILHILLTENIDPERICRKRPTQITFVVDLNSLKHPDDIKKDQFGKWCYSTLCRTELGNWIQTFSSSRKRAVSLLKIPSSSAGYAASIRKMLIFNGC